MNNELGIIITKIRERRKALHLSQKEVADKCGLKQANYSRMESGKQSPTLETLLQIADAVNLRIELIPNEMTVYHVMFRDELVTVVSLSKDKKTIHFNKIKEDGIFQPFSGEKLDLERFYRFIKSRCYEDGRADLDEILKQAHLSSNNPYDFIRISHGVTYSDDFWIKDENEKITWKDVKVR